LVQDNLITVKIEYGGRSHYKHFTSRDGFTYGRLAILVNETIVEWIDRYNDGQVDHFPRVLVGFEIDHSSTSDRANGFAPIVVTQITSV
jgi:hypothetical protein